MDVNQGTLHSFVTNVSEYFFQGQCKLLQWKLKVYFKAKLCKVVC